jgi:hypothetical protein
MTADQRPKPRPLKKSEGFCIVLRRSSRVLAYLRLLSEELPNAIARIEGENDEYQRLLTAQTEIQRLRKKIGSVLVYIE